MMKKAGGIISAMLMGMGTGVTMGASTAGDFRVQAE